jgi:hypothetical protein
MRFCVIKNTVTVIDGSNNNDATMLKNVTNIGLSANDVEILSEDEYKQRLDSIPPTPQPPTTEERIASLEEATLAMMEVLASV